MAVFTFEQVFKELENKIYRPVYLLMGKEPYFIDKITDYIETSILDESAKDFNLSVLYGKEVSVADVISAARRYPMMSDYQVVILKDAQNLKDFDKLVSYVENPLPSTILVIAYKNGSYDKRKRLTKIVSQNYVLFESQEIKEYKVGDFIKKYLKVKGFDIEEKAVAMLVEFLGNNISQITNELDKLAILLENRKNITAADIEKNIGISKDYNVFELINAIGSKDFYRAQFIAQQFSKNSKSHPFIFTVQMIYQYFVKLLNIHQLKARKLSTKEIASKLEINHYFYKDYENAAKKYPVGKIVKNLELLHEYDMKSKGVGIADIDEGELLKELLFRLMN